MRAPGTGSITKLASGRWWLRISLDDGSRRSLGTFASRGEAERVLAAVVARLAAPGGVVVSGGLACRDWGERILDERERDGVRGIATERSRWRTHLVTAPFADDPIRMVHQAEVVALLRSMSHRRAADRRGRRCISRATAQRCFSLLRCIFDEAVVAGHIEQNPCAGLKISKIVKRLARDDADTEQKWDYLRLDEQTALVGCATIPTWARLLMKFAIGTGLRQGEQWNLELRDLHVDGTKPYLYVRFGSRGKKPKSGKTRRVPLFGGALEAAKEWLLLLPSYAPDNPFGLVFPTRTGCRRRVGPPSRCERDAATQTIRKIYLFPEWLREAGVERCLRWHDLRHTCASSLVAGWWGRCWSLLEVKDLLGHSSVKVTERYAHLADSALDQAARETSASSLANE